MSEEGTTSESGETVTGPFKDLPLTTREHMDPDKHWIGETLAPPTQSEIAATIGSTSQVGESPFAARADHTHKLDAGYTPGCLVYFTGSPISATTSITTAAWLTVGTINVPTWATIAFVQVNLSGIYTVTATAVYGLDVAIWGSTFGGDFAVVSQAAINQRESVCYCKNVTGFLKGTQSVLVGARRSGGSGVLTFDGSSRCCVGIWFGVA